MGAELPEDVASNAVSYLLGLADWRPKLRLARLVRMVDSDIFASFRRDLVQLQDDTGLFPLFWTAGQTGSLRYSAMAIDCLSESEDEVAKKSVRAAHRAITSLQAVDGSWSESPDMLGKLKRRKMHPGWSQDLDRAEISSIMIGALGKGPLNPEGDGVTLSGREWLERFHKGQDFETRRSGDMYSLNPWTLDLVVSALLDSGIEPLRPSMNDAVNVLRLNLERALLRRLGYSPWSLLAGTRTLLMLEGHRDLLNRVALELSNDQNRDGSWRQGRGTKANDHSDLTLHALSFLTSLEPSIRRHCNDAVTGSLSLRSFVASTLQNNDAITRQIFLTRFEEVGVKPDLPREHLLFASFVYSILEQFYWVTSDFDPQSEYLRLIMQMGRLERVGLDGYTDSQAVRRALFRSQILRDQASTRKGEVAHSISLFAAFLKTSKKESFREFALTLRRFALEKAPDLGIGWKRDTLLGGLLRLEVRQKDDPISLMRTLESALKCFPGVGEKVSALFLYYAGYIFNIWKDIPHDLIEVPVDWNLVKPYAMLGLTSTPLEQLKERPQLATDSIQETAREMFRDDPGKLYGLWVVGHEWCARPWMCRDKTGRYCWLYAQCPYPRSRR